MENPVGITSAEEERASVKTRLSLLFGALLVSSCTSGATIGQSIPSAALSAQPAARETVAVESILGDYTINTVRISHGFNADCTLHKDGEDAKGCDVVSAVTGKITSSTFTMYTEPRAKGCAVAEGHYKGDVTAKEVIPITFKAINLHCWKTARQ
jgi:hypothetical protein